MTVTRTRITSGIILTFMFYIVSVLKQGQGTYHIFAFFFTPWSAGTPKSIIRLALFFVELLLFLLLLPIYSYIT